VVNGLSKHVLLEPVGRGRFASMTSTLQCPVGASGAGTVLSFLASMIEVTAH
jgi:hypothetical protein